MRPTTQIDAVSDGEGDSSGNSTCASPDPCCSLPPSPNPNGAPLSRHPPHDRYAKSPFNRVDADVILTSSDKIDFFLHTPVLKLASPALNQVASRNHHLNSVAKVEKRDDRELPVYRVYEDSATLDRLLRFLYPTEAPDVDDLDFPSVAKLYTAAKKYEIGFLENSMMDRLFGKLQTKGPMETFALSCQLGLEPLARDIADNIRCNIEDFRGILEFHNIRGMEDLTAGQYHRLISYLEDPFCSDGRLSIYLHRDLPINFPEKFLSKLPATTGYRNGSLPDITVRSGDGVFYPAHWVALSNASPEFRHSERNEPQAVVLIHESSTTTAALLALCYSSFDFKIDDLDFLHHLMQIARKYEMTNAIERMRGVFLTLVEKQRDVIHLIHSFCRAAMYGWEQETRVIAEWISQRAEGPVRCRDVPPFPEMEEIPVAPFATLLGRLHHERLVTVPRNPLSRVLVRLGSAGSASDS